MTLVCVLVHTRDLSQHWVPGDSLPHWPAAAAWWEQIAAERSQKENAQNCCSSQPLQPLVYTRFTLRELARLSWLLQVRYILGSISSCWTVIAYRSLCLKQLTYGMKRTLQADWIRTWNSSTAPFAR